MIKWILLPLILLLIARTAQAQNDFAAFEQHLYVNGTDSMHYRLLLPDNYNTEQAYPLLLFLHGAGERGNDNNSQLRHGMARFLQNDVRNDFPCIVLAPQCANDDRWSNVFEKRDSMGKRVFEFQEKGNPTHAMTLAINLFRSTLTQYSVDLSRLYIGGISMGGMGTFEFVRRVPNVFAAAFPICGGAHPSTATKINDTAWWIFHGQLDDVVPPRLSQDMFVALQDAGASVGFTLYPHAKHNSWDPAFNDHELLIWLFEQKRK
jgi:predicted peptidase